MSWWTKFLELLGKKKAEVVVQVHKTVDEIADDVSREAAELFQRARDARESAAKMLEEAAEDAKLQATALVAEAERQAASLKARAEALEDIAKERIAKAKQHHSAADKLNDLV